ncbi:MAG: dipeptidase [Deltaproteobacteria bacterium]|nr:dipeptidase [Deltaproteobacteria bacterium]
MQKVLDVIAKNQDRYLEELYEVLRIQSVSADPARAGEVRRCGQWFVDRLTRAGLENVRLMETGGHPAVYADWLHAPGKPTVMVYGHYDVQPEDPTDKWTTPPFEPTVRDGVMYGRGTSDDKAQVMTHVAALEAWLEANGALPLNVKVFIEGEEEGGAGGTHEFVRKNRELLACDAVAVSDTAWHSPEHPTVVYALRGMCYMEVKVKGPSRDLHSGVYGGIVQNPLNALAKIIAALQDEHGRVTVPGFYDDVVPLTDAERAEFATVAPTEERICADLGVPATWGEEGYTPTERNWARPSFDVHGVWGGFSGEGSKTVIASEGGFKVSTRLVANQDGKKVFEAFKAHVARICPPGVTAEVKFLHAATPVMVPTSSPFMAAGQRAFESAFGRRPTLVREGASIPITATFLEALKAPSIMVGYGLPGDNIHSPNENFRIEHFRKGIVCGAWLLDEFSRVEP